MNHPIPRLVVVVICLANPALANCQTEGCFPEPSEGPSNASSAQQVRHSERLVPPKPDESRRLERAYPNADGKMRMEAAVACGTAAVGSSEESAQQTSFEVRHRDALRKLEMRRRQSKGRVEPTAPLLNAEPAPEVRCGETINERTAIRQVSASGLPTNDPRSGQVYARRRTMPRPMETVGCISNPQVQEERLTQPTWRQATTRTAPRTTSADSNRSRGGPIVSAARPSEIPPHLSVSNRFKSAMDRHDKVSKARFDPHRTSFIPSSRPNSAPVPLPATVALGATSPDSTTSQVRLVQATEDILIPEPYGSTIESPLSELPVGNESPAEGGDFSSTPSPCDNVGDGPDGSPCDSAPSTFPSLPSLESSVTNPFDEPVMPAIPNESATKKTLADMQLGKVFSRLESLPDRFVPRPSPSPSPSASRRDPYAGSSEQFGFRWTPRNLAHRTLYFEDMPLERYGLTHGRYQQMLASAKEFFYDAAVMPLRWGKELKCDLHYTLGLERAGSCPPRIEERACPVP